VVVVVMLFVRIF